MIAGFITKTITHTQLVGAGEKKRKKCMSCDYIHINLDITQNQKMQRLKFFNELFNFNRDFEISVKSMLYRKIPFFTT